MTFLCIASYEKGRDFMRKAKELGNNVLLLTSKKLAGSPWPRESIDEIYYIPNEKSWEIPNLINAVSYLARSVKIDRIIALDDFDVEKAASLREHLRIPGMGETTARYFRDKLAMRIRAKEIGLNIPDFVRVLNYDEINEFFGRTEPPYILKPRMQAGAIGITKIESKEQFWKRIEELGDKQSYYLLEQFVAGKIHHVDTILFDREVKYSVAGEYGLPPFEVAHQGRVFTSRLMEYGSKEAEELRLLNEKALKGLGLVKGVSHTEFIRSEKDGKLYFLETSARVGGANLSEMIKAGTGVNLWEEWAKLETLEDGDKYELPEIEKNYSAIITSLAKQKGPDLSIFSEPEVVWKLKKDYHAGLILSSPKYERVSELLDKHTKLFYDNFFTSQPMKEKAAD
ncbi:MAG: ATP-grasp domain-containing protein [Chlorobi bacterium]|nr:ATP-grasp domain-containing protein [Chlorobiota bacterium]